MNFSVCDYDVLSSTPVLLPQPCISHPTSFLLDRMVRSRLQCCTERKKKTFYRFGIFLNLEL